MELPLALREAIDNELSGVPANRLAAVAAELSQRYRSGATGAQPFLRSRQDAAAYAAFRMPATFAAVAAALSQVREQLPEWQPRTLTDVGAGPGTAMWAACSVWTSLEQVTLYERDRDMMALGQRLARRSETPAVRHATWHEADIRATWDAPASDLVIASYVIGELAENDQSALLDRLWQATHGALVVIEPGTPAGFERIRRARAALTAAGGNIIAPCPHAGQCPMSAGDWCHFAQRIARSRLHRQVKGADLGYEDEKFSFIAAARPPLARAAGPADQVSEARIREGRILRHPQVRAGHIRLDLCTAEGLQQTVVTRKDKEAFRRARSARWGDVWPLDP